MESVFQNYSESINSLMVYVKSNNIDVSTQEKFSEAMKSWYISQRKLDDKIASMPISALKNKLQIK